MALIALHRMMPSDSTHLTPMVFQPDSCGGVRAVDVNRVTLRSIERPIAETRAMWINKNVGRHATCKGSTIGDRRRLVVCLE